MYTNSDVCMYSSITFQRANICGASYCNVEKAAIFLLVKIDDLSCWKTCSCFKIPPDLSESIQ